MPEITDEIADRILDDLDALKLTPAETARQSRRLREYIADLREPSTEQLVRDLGETPTSWEEPGVPPNDGLMDQLIVDARQWVRMRDRT